MKNYWLICITLLTFSTHAQEKEAPLEPQLTVKDATTIARYLQQTKDIKTAVNLTQTAWRMTSSFASDEQLISQWETALDVAKLTDTNTPNPDMTQDGNIQSQLAHGEQSDISQDATNNDTPDEKLLTFTTQPAYPTINSHLTAGQFLIQFSDGMNLDDWRLVDLPLITEFNPDPENTSASEYFSYYVNLPLYWHQLMTRMNPTATWLVFPELENTIEPSTTENDTLDETKQPAVLDQLLTSVQTNISLNEVLSKLSPKDTLNSTHTALLRAHYHTQNSQWLALFYDWIELYQLTENNTQLLTANQQELFNQYIIKTQAMWITNQAAIDAIDHRMYPIMSLVLNQLPEKFKNPDHFNEAINLLIFQMVWEMDQAANYASHLLRKDINNNLEVCLNLSAIETPNPQPPMGEKQFQSCLNDFASWGNENATSSSLSGKLLQLNGALALYRALDSPHFQITNFLAMSAESNSTCQKEISLKANPVEWTLAAESMAWLHDRWPGLMTELTDKNPLSALLKTGQNINLKPDCLVANEALEKQYETLKAQWLKLKAAINEQLITYRTNHLAENSQIDFFQPVNQFTQLKPDAIQIAPCDVAKACGAFVQLPATTALFDLFPNHLKMAQQFGLGKLKLCYDQVEWKNRQTEPTHLDNNSIANFTGNLSIQLTGTYKDDTVFTKLLQGESRHLYLFGENAESVLDMGCPLPIIGHQINTQLERGTFGLFPNRLTFLTAQRTSINTVIRNNWSEGENWQSKFADENNSTILFYDEKAEIKQQVNDAFLTHSNAVQQQIYRKLMYSNPARINDSALSLAAFEYLTERELFNKMTQSLFPEAYAHKPIRSLLKGDMRLMDADFFKAAFENQSNLLDMLNKGDELIHKNQNIWRTLESPTPVNNINSTLQQLKQAIQFNQQIKPPENNTIQSLITDS